MSFESSDELREVLPILPGLELEELARINALIAVASPQDQLLAAAYEADAAALADVAELHQGDHPVMEGFLASVMAGIAAESEAEQDASDEERAPAPVSVAEPAGELLRPRFGAQLWLAIAAMLLVGLGLGVWGLGANESQGHSPLGAGEGAESLASSEEGGLTLELPGATQVEAVELSSPNRNVKGRRVRRAQPRGNPGIVPVDGRGRRGNADPIMDALRRLSEARSDAQRARSLPPVREGERELKF